MCSCDAQSNHLFTRQVFQSSVIVSTFVVGGSTVVLLNAVSGLDVHRDATLICD